jgi:hypothetical protein
VADARFRRVLPFTLTLLITSTLLTAGAAAQSLNPGPPGPYVFDFRGVTSGVPSSEAFLSDATGVTLPTRGFGGGVGGHFYLIRIGPTRLGVGLDLMAVRGTAEDVTTRLTAVDPQLSLNFGSGDGWSYLSAGVGVAHVSTDPSGISETVQSFNWGGGARWFLGPHFGIGFDVRIRTLSAGDVVPKGTSVGIGVGVSLK